MNSFLNGLKDTANYGYTENGSIKRLTTNSALLDMFAMGGAYRSRSEEDVILMFQKAYNEDAKYALKCLFYLRDAREGQGERRFFRICMRWLARTDVEAARRNLQYVAEYGRWDDLYIFVGTPLEAEMFQMMKEQLALDIESKTPSLLAKWLKSENTSSIESRRLADRTRRYFNMTHKQYRKTLSVLRERIHLLERLMSENRWEDIDFSKIPSKAGFRYKNAFARHDIERMQSEKNLQTYADFAKDTSTRVNADVLNPVDIANRIFGGQVRTDTDRAIIDKYWSCLKDYYNGRQENGIAIVDVSGSMSGQPMNAAVSMGAYIAERGKGPFKDHFITFSNDPALVCFEGVDTYDKFRRASTADWGGSTNIEATFDMMLNVALQNHVSASDMPQTLYIFSDMEYNCCMSCGARSTNRWGYNSRINDGEAGINTLLEGIAQKWARYGYELPRVIFWNLDARQNNIPALGGRFSYVSGFSMNMVETILSGKDGYDLMMDKLNTPRYECIH